VLAVHVSFVALSLRDDVVFAEVVFRHFAKRLFALDPPSAEFPAKLQIPVLGGCLGFGEALFLVCWSDDSCPRNSLSTARGCGSGVCRRGDLPPRIVGCSGIFASSGKWRENSKMCNECVSYTRFEIMSVNSIFSARYMNSRKYQ
jgi:hypothetical protein